MIIIKVDQYRPNTLKELNYVDCSDRQIDIFKNGKERLNHLKNRTKICHVPSPTPPPPITGLQNFNIR